LLVNAAVGLWLIDQPTTRRLDAAAEHELGVALADGGDRHA